MFDRSIIRGDPLRGRPSIDTAASRPPIVDLSKSQGFKHHKVVTLLPVQTAGPLTCGFDVEGCDLGSGLLSFTASHVDARRFTGDNDRRGLTSHQMWAGKTCTKEGSHLMNDDITTPTLREIAETHIRRLAEIHKVAKNTVNGYKTCYNQFIRYMAPRLKREPLVTDLTADNVSLFFDDVVAKNSDGTYSTRTSQFAGISSWLMDNEHIPYGPSLARKIAPRKTNQVGTRKDGKGGTARMGLPDDKFVGLLNLARKRHLRDVYLLLFARRSGRRIREITALTWGDVDWNERDIYYDNTKARKLARRMPLRDDILELLTQWREAYEAEIRRPVRDDMYIFPAFTAAGGSYKGRRRPVRLTPRFRIGDPAKIIHDYFVALGVYRKGMGWHSLRRELGEEVRKKRKATGAASPIEDVKMALDHSDSTISRVYIDYDEEYEEFKADVLKMEAFSAEIRAAIPELAGLEPAPSPVEEAEPEAAPLPLGGNVIPLASRRRA